MPSRSWQIRTAAGGATEEHTPLRGNRAKSDLADVDRE